MTYYYAKLDGTRILNADRSVAGNDDTNVGSWVKTNQFIYAIQIGYNGRDTAASTYQLMWRVAGGMFANVGLDTAIKYTTGTVLSDNGTVGVTGPVGTGKTARCTAQSGETWADKAGTEIEDSLSPSIDLASDNYTELQFGLDCSGATEGATYEFQLWGVAQGAVLTVEGGAYAKLTLAADQPSVTLNTANAHDFVGNPPILEFTGTDTSGSPIRYNIQIDTVATFDSAGLIDRLSGADVGFTGSPDNSDPYASAQLVSYAVQTATLAEGTYYWRIRAMDPTPPGSGSYGSWATARTFSFGGQPSVALDTVDAYEFGADPTPALEFTGTDVGGNSVRYQIQINNVNDFTGTVLLDKVSGTDLGFTNQTPQEVVFPVSVSADDGYWANFADDIHYFTSTEWYIIFGGYGGDLSHFSFARFPGVTIPNGATIISAKIRIVADQSSAGVVASSLIHFNDVDNAVAPSGYADGNGLALTDGVAWNNIPPWVAGVTYESPGVASILQAIVNRADYASGNAIMMVAADNGSDEVVGVGRYAKSRSYSSEVAARLVAVFEGGPASADTDPFNSGEKCSYTVQSADELANGTYYWRVRGIDPSPGSGTYGAWTAARSFTIGTGGGGGLNVQVNVAGVMKAVSAASILVEGVWKAVSAIKIKAAGSWRSV